jgi:hypothetical protein
MTKENDSENTEVKEEEKTMRDLTLENQRLLTENNKLLKKLNHQARVSFWFRVVWFLFIIGAPFIIYFYVVEPYFTSFGSSIDIFREGIQEIPGWKQLNESMQGGTSTAE